MLAKIWKKLLLAICIIACIYNVMNKLVSRTSLETQLKNIEVGSTVSNEENKKTKINNSSKVDKTEKNSVYNKENDEEDDENKSEFVVVFDE